MKMKRKPAAAKQAKAPNAEVNPSGGPMFRDILRQIRRIPRGKVATYGDVAYAAGYPGAARQVAWALHGRGRTVPWQRVIGSGGKILCTGELGLEQHRFHFFGNRQDGKRKKKTGREAKRKKT
jgi:methylated-DNA-protein-cysteine methyltransferase-like protein